MTEQTPCTIVRRGEGGRFLPGTAGGPGRTPEKVVALREAMLSAVEPNDIADLTRKLFEMAMAGDLKAADVLLKRLLPSGGAGSVQVAIQNNVGGNRERMLAIAERIKRERQAEQQHEEATTRR